MKTVLFATGNSRKIQEANATLAQYKIIIEPIKLAIDEIQSSDPADVVKAKAISAYTLCQKPVVVSDTSWSIPALGGFPGAYMKDIEGWLAAEDWLALMKRHKDKTIYCHEHIAYYDGANLQHFEETYTGRFIDELRGKVADDESFESCVILYGDQTMGEQLAQGDIASAGDELHHWKQFGAWYGGQE